MLQEKHSIEYLKSKVESEGIGYTILYYFGKDVIEDIENDDLRKAWEEAYVALKKIEKILGI